MQTLQIQIAELIRSRRRELQINQNHLADLSGVALRTLRDLEKGLGNPSLLTISNVMEVLGIELVFRLKA
jgi:transcriptional regulator with XRE-family HTH domain